MIANASRLRIPSSAAIRRAGFTLMECSAAIALLGAALVLAIKLQVGAATQRRASDQRQLGIREVANLMERLTAEPYEKLDNARAAEFDLSERASQSLPESTLSIDVAGETIAPGVEAKRIQIALAWPGRSGEKSSPVRLTAWVFAPAASPNTRPGASP